MRIVHFSAGRINPNAAKVGSVNVIYWLAREQARMGHDVSVVVVPAKTDYENITNLEFHMREYSPAKMGGFFLPKDLREDIRCGRIPIDIAHLHSVFSPEMVAVSHILAERGVPYVVTSHGSFSPLIGKDRPLLKWGFTKVFARSYVNRASFVHLHSEGEVKDAKRFGVKVPLVVAEQGIDMEAVPSAVDPFWLDKEFPRFRGAFKLLFLGRLDPWHKGIDLLLQALARTISSAGPIVLFLVGPEKRRFAGCVPALVRSLELQDYVVCVGPLYEPYAKYSALASADLFVLTSRFEGFPLVIWEALAAGTPVLVTPGTNAAEVVSKHGIGFVCSGDPSAISKAIDQVLAAPGSLKEMGARGKEIVKQFSWRRTASVLLNSYVSVLGGAAS